MTDAVGAPPLDARAYREVFGHLPTGVVAVTAFDPTGEPLGMACNSVSSVSIEPPLVLFCPARTSTTWPGLRDAGRLCLNVLAEDHADVSRQFARRGADRFADLSWHPRPAGPAIDDAVAWIECEIEDEHPAGDHTIVVARVASLEANEGRSPIVFFRGDYGKIATAAQGAAVTSSKSNANATHAPQEENE
ncbi:MAG: flavin reductase family protein [Actinobacteria bacterium]|nr:flavin reductase family protein [Actinomycetota bacterium]